MTFKHKFLPFAGLLGAVAGAALLFWPDDEPSNPGTTLAESAPARKNVAEVPLALPKTAGSPATGGSAPRAAASSTETTSPTAGVAPAPADWQLAIQDQAIAVAARPEFSGRLQLRAYECEGQRCRGGATVVERNHPNMVIAQYLDALKALPVIRDSQGLKTVLLEGIEPEADGARFRFSVAQLAAPLPGPKAEHILDAWRQAHPEDFVPPPENP